MPAVTFYLVILLVFLVALLGLIKAFRVFNSPDGERYRRMRMQGPFVPLNDDEIAADEARIEARRK